MSERKGESAEDCIVPATRTPEEIQEVIARALNREVWTCVRGDGTGAHHYVCNNPLGICTEFGMVNQLITRGRTLEQAKELVSAKVTLYI